MEKNSEQRTGVVEMVPVTDMKYGQHKFDKLIGLVKFMVFSTAAVISVFCLSKK